MEEETVKPETMKAWIAFQSEVRDPEKSAENPHFRSKYADLLTVLRAVRPVLQKHGFALIQLVDNDRSPTNPGMPVVRTEIWHESGECLFASNVPLVLEKQTMQAQGSAISYARRYGITALCGVAAQDEDDDGEAANGRGRQPAARKQGSGAALVEAIDGGAGTKELAQRVSDLAMAAKPRGLGMNNNHLVNWMTKLWGKGRLLQLTMQQQQDACSLLEARLRSEEDYAELLTHLGLKESA